MLLGHRLIDSCWLRNILRRKVVETAIEKRPRTGISRGNDCDEICALRGRRKSLQKLAKRRAFVFFLGGGGGLDCFRKASFKKKKKIELHVDYVRCAPLGPAANRLELDRAAQGLRYERVRRTSPSNAL